MSAAQVRTRTPDETFALGERLGRLLQPGDFVGLTGELGAGKTLFARGVAQGAGVPLDDVSSPTFAIVQSYAGRSLTLHHADLYRLRDVRDLFGVGYFDLLESGGALLVEWVARIPEAAPADWLSLSLTPEGETERRLDAVAHGPRAEALLAAWLKGP